MLKITFLGTAGSTPTKSKGLPSLAIDYNSEVFLFDCGEGTQRQMMQYSVNIARVKAVFLTHTHGDHTLGTAGLVRTMALNRRTLPLYVFIPKGGEKMIRELIDFDKAVIKYKIEIKTVNSGIIYKGKGFSISAFKLMHTTSTYGFAFKEDDRLRFIKPAVKRLGIKGTMFASLLKKKSIKISNKRVRLKDVTVKQQGRKIVYATDTRPARDTLSAAMDADILIHESTYADAEKALAKERFHSTTLEAALLAKKARAKRLVLTHTSARYRDDEMLAKEARRTFKNTIVAKDGMAINL